MKSKTFRPMILRILAAVLVAGVWAFHVAETQHDLNDNDCQICAIFCSPELNADCGARLVSEPDNHGVLRIVSDLLLNEQSAPLCFNSRAPPLSA